MFFTRGTRLRLPHTPRLNRKHPFARADRVFVGLTPPYVELASGRGLGIETAGRRLGQYGAPYHGVMPQANYESSQPFGVAPLDSSRDITLFALFRTWSTFASSNYGGIVGVGVAGDTAWLAVDTFGKFMLLNGVGYNFIADTSTAQMSAPGEWWAIAGVIVNNSTESFIRAKKFGSGSITKEVATLAYKREGTVSSPQVYRGIGNLFQKGFCLFGASLRRSKLDEVLEWVNNPLGIVEEAPARRLLFDMSFIRPTTVGASIGDSELAQITARAGVARSGLSRSNVAPHEILSLAAPYELKDHSGSKSDQIIWDRPVAKNGNPDDTPSSWANMRE